MSLGRVTVSVQEAQSDGSHGLEERGGAVLQVQVLADPGQGLEDFGHTSSGQREGQQGQLSIRGHTAAGSHVNRERDI